MHAIYERSFGMRAPYQLILDGPFLEIALQQKMYFKESLPNLVGGATRLFTTNCVLRELKSKESPAVFNAKRLEMIKMCRHEQSTTGADCIKSIVGESNKHHFGVCAQQDDLRYALREVPGVPLCFINRGILLMEPPSEATIKMASQLNKSKQSVDEAEKKAIDKIAPVVAPLEEKKKKKKKRGANPNPLSCKKPKSDKGKKVSGEDARNPRKRTRKLIK
jgi:U3 small nucleolar RNA-associated protein 23